MDYSSNKSIHDIIAGMGRGFFRVLLLLPYLYSTCGGSEKKGLGEWIINTEKSDVVGVVRSRRKKSDVLQVQ